MSKEKVIPTQEDYISELIEAKRAIALDKSRNRTSVKVPMVTNDLSKEEWLRFKNREIAEKEQKLSAAKAEGDEISAKLYEKELNKALEELEKGYPTLIPGANCMYNAGDCYGLNIPGNRTFAAKHENLGFKKISSKQMKPGDIVQDNRVGTPSHAMIYDSKDNEGKPLFNYARGTSIGDINIDYVKQGKYPLPLDDYAAYRYVGTPADSAQWISLYNLIYGLGKGGIIGIPYLKKGSGIHIKKKNRGKFTEYCGGEVTDKCILKAKKSKNPVLRKRATFALNSRSWSKKHQDGDKIRRLKKYEKRGLIGVPSLKSGEVSIKKLVKKHQFGGGIGTFPGLRFINWLFSPKKEMAERVMHTSASPGVAAAGLILNPFNEKNYTGSYKYNHNTSEEGINFVNKNPFADNNTFEDRDHVKLFLYGDEKGFEKSDEPEIIVNGEKWTSKQYKGKMMPMDTLYLSDRMRPFIQNLIRKKLIINFDENNKLSDGSKYQKYDGVMMDNVASYNGRFSNAGTQHYLNNFDLIDYEPELFSKNWGKTTKFLAGQLLKAGLPTKKYPNAGPFVLRLDRIPIVYTNGDNDDKYILQKLNIKGGNDATKQFHQDYWNSVFNVK